MKKIRYFLLTLIFLNMLNVIKSDIHGQNTYELTAQFQMENIIDFAMSPNESLLAVVNNEHNIVLLNMPSLDIVYTFEKGNDGMCQAF